MDYTVPEGVTSVGAGAFFGCVGLKRDVIPWSVKTIGAEAFEDCDNITVAFKGREYGYKQLDELYEAING